jgi:hypothetical protein
MGAGDMVGGDRQRGYTGKGDIWWEETGKGDIRLEEMGEHAAWFAPDLQPTCLIPILCKYVG